MDFDAAYFLTVIEHQKQKGNTMEIECILTSTRKIKCRLQSEKIDKGVQFASWVPKDLEKAEIINFNKLPSI